MKTLLVLWYLLPNLLITVDKCTSDPSFVIAEQDVALAKSYYSCTRADGTKAIKAESY